MIKFWLAMNVFVSLYMLSAFIFGGLKLFTVPGIIISLFLLLNIWQFINGIKRLNKNKKQDE